MGCASSKKRTTSVDDLTKADKKEPLGSTPKKNGQLSNDARHKDKGAGDSSKAIQIPGANKSFMAPDGIPFIDEDVDDDAETGGAVVVANATSPTAKADVNRNVVAADVKPTGPPTAAPVDVAAEEKKKEEIGTEIMKREIEMTQQTTSTVTTTSAGAELMHIEQVVVTTHPETQPVVNGVEPASEQEQQKAAVKIQAGIRGYRDRQRVKALRASQQPQQETSTPMTNGDQPVIDGPADDAAEHDNVQESAGQDETEETAHSPEMDRAAVKIQASYKGYKTRKQLGKI